MAKWRWYNRGTIYPHRADIAQLGMSRFGRLNLTPITNDLYINVGAKLWWAWDDQEITKLGWAVLNQCRTKKQAKAHIKTLILLLHKAIKFADSFKAKDLSRLSNKKLSQQYSLIYKASLKTHGILNDDVDGFDVVFDEFLQSLVAKQIDKNSKIFWQVYKELANTKYQSYLLQLEYQAAKLVAAGVNKDLAAQQLYSSYWWMNLGWENMVPHTYEYFFKYVQKVKPTQARQLIKNYEAKLKNIQARRGLLIKKYNLPSNIKHRLNVLDDYAYLHDYRKEMQVKTNYACHRILVETARRLKYKASDLEWLFHNEVRSLLLGKKINRLLIKQRRQCVVSLIIRNKIHVYQGAVAKKIKQANLNLDRKTISSVTGLAVTKGCVRGRALVCQGGKEAIKKIRKGDILICPMTMPDYLPALKIAKGIVTEEGGLTSHAAIVARELKKVCIVGTKEATRVFKTGDQIEVNANKGIVRKI